MLSKWTDEMKWKDPMNKNLLSYLHFFGKEGWKGGYRVGVLGSGSTKLLSVTQVKADMSLGH